MPIWTNTAYNQKLNDMKANPKTKSHVEAIKQYLEIKDKLFFIKSNYPQLLNALNI